MTITRAFKTLANSLGRPVWRGPSLNSAFGTIAFTGGSMGAALLIQFGGDYTKLTAQPGFPASQEIFLLAESAKVAGYFGWGFAAAAAIALGTVFHDCFRFDRPAASPTQPTPATP